MYSQNDEERYILEAFADNVLGRPIGRFLDIGGYHPKDNSNTRALAELGWVGVIAEPSPGAMMALLREYGDDERITLINAAVGVAARLAKMHISDDALSTVNWGHHERCLAAGYTFYGTFLVPQLTLERIFMEVGNVFDFVSIDIEGESAELFLQYLEILTEHPAHAYKSAPPPRCFCVEHDRRQAEITEAALQKGYRVALRNGENLVLVKA
jgi:FkbM family methyltransferase